MVDATLQSHRRNSRALSRYYYARVARNFSRRSDRAGQLACEPREHRQRIRRHVVEDVLRFESRTALMIAGQNSRKAEKALLILALVKIRSHKRFSMVQEVG